MTRSVMRGSWAPALLCFLWFPCAAAGQAAGVPPRMAHRGYDMRNDLRPSRLTIAMWDFCWAYMHYKGGAYEDWKKVCSELTDRGFNTVRIDAFPMIIGRLKSLDEEVSLRGNPLRTWGFTDKDRKHPLAEDLVEFVKTAEKAGLFVILSTWNHDCVEYPKLREYYAKNRKLYWKAWERVLDLLGKNGLLDRVLYVDLDQEFPWFSPFAPELNRLGKGGEAEGDDMEKAGRIPGFAWNRRQLDFVKDYLGSSLKHFQRLYPGLRFTFSFTSFWKEIRSLGLKSFDVLEVHIWMTTMERFQARTGFGGLKKDRGKRSYADYMRRLKATMKSVRPMLLAEMRNQMRFAADWAREIAAPLTTTEAWGPWWHMDHPDLEWRWLYDWCEQCAAMAPEFGFWGITPWNYSHPFWKNWSNVEWYRRVNLRFLGS